MATLHSLLALYGALDDTVVFVDDPEVTATVERFLPNTTGPEQRGWFDDIRSFVRRLSVDPDQTEFPSLTKALQEFAETRRSTENSADVGIGPVELARLLYVVGAHWKLDSRTDDTRRDLFANALSVAVPGETIRESYDGSQALLDLFDNRLNSVDDFRAVIEIAATAERPLVNEAVRLYVRDIDISVDVRRDACGEYAVLDAEYFRDQLPLDNVKNVVDPLNWSRCCPFFCDMKPIPTTPDSYGWSRVLESISTLCGIVPGYRLRTALKYWKGERPSGAFVNYDLDDDRATTADDGFTLVDRGFINFEQENQDVRIHTRKEVKFAGVPALATIMFALIGGYATIGESMLVGCAVNLPGNLVDWQPSVSTGKPAKPFDPTVCASAPAPSAPCGCTQPLAPAVAEAVELWTDCVTEISTEYADVVNRWAKRGFDPVEMANFSAKVSTRLATDPLRFWSLLLNPRGTDE